MNKELVATIFKPLASVIGWIGGAVAGITIILSAAGYLVIRAHQDLLGITGLVPIPPESWTIEGARFVYNSVFYLVGSLYPPGSGALLILLSAVLCILLIEKELLASIHDYLDKRLLRKIFKCLIIIGMFIGVLFMLRGFLVHNATSRLLLEPPTYDTRSTTQGIQELRRTYALLFSSLLLVFFALRLLPRPQGLYLRLYENTHDSSSSSGRWLLLCQYLLSSALWLFFFISVVLLPMNYGKMAKSNDFFKVRLLKTVELPSQPSQTKATQQPLQYEGWLLYEDSKKLVLYLGTSENEPIRIFKGDEFAQVQVLTYDNIFSGQ